MNAKEMVSLIVSGGVAFAITLLLTPLFRQWSLGRGLLDIPNARSSHQIPTPRSGGKAMVIGFATALGLAATLVPLAALLPYLIALPLVILSGILDDVKGLREWNKLFLQIAATAVLLGMGSPLISLLKIGRFTVDLKILALPVTVLWIVGFTNVFNFMDGINGIASLHAIVAGTVLAILAVRRGDLSGAVLALGMVGCAAGFLPWNLFSGSIFMGDTGSAFFGFLIAALAVRQPPEDFLLAAFVTFPFVFDAAWTLTTRIARREDWLRAHRGHLYQRLTQTGWSHVQVALLWTLLSCGCGFVALRCLKGQDTVCIAAIAAMVAAHVRIAFWILSRRRPLENSNFPRLSDPML